MTFICSQNCTKFVCKKQEEDSKGVVVAAWGGVCTFDFAPEVSLVGMLRVLLGMDSSLPAGWHRVPSPVSGWELRRLHLRF